MTHPSTRLALLLGACTALGACEFETDDSLLDLEQTEQEIASGWNSPSNTIENAVVNVLYSGGACTGTLIAQDKVLLAAHCNLWVDPTKADGKWHRSPVPAFVQFGPTNGAPIQTITANYYSMPPARLSDGRVDDIGIWQLDRPASPTLAIPREVLLTKPRFVGSTLIGESGYGAGRNRQNTLGNRYDDWMSDSALQTNWVEYQPFTTGPGIGNAGTNVEFGDSGGPFMYGGVTGPVFAVLGWWNPSGIATFATGDGDSPNIAAWLAEHLFEEDYHGYVWAHSDTGVYAAHSSYSHNPSGGAINVAYLGGGRYRASFSGAARARNANVQVSAYGGDSNYCKLDRVDTAADTLNVYVACFTHTGAWARSKFAVTWVASHDDGGSGIAYVSTTGGGTAIDATWNSAGADNTITTLGVGRYRVTMPGQGSYRSSVQITATGNNANHCKVKSWGSTQVDVSCYDHAGHAIAADFHAVKVAARTLHGSHGGHVWANNASATSYTPSSSYSFNSTGGSNTAGRIGNTHFVDFGGLAYNRSTAQVTAYGSGAAYCKLADWGATSYSYTRVKVACFDHDGSPELTRFNATYLRQ